MKPTMYHDDIRQMIQEALRPARKDSTTKMPEGPSAGYVKDVADDHFVIEKDGQLFRQPYAVKNGKISLTGTRTRLVKAYVPASEGKVKAMDAAMAKTMKQRMGRDPK